MDAVLFIVAVYLDSGAVGWGRGVGGTYFICLGFSSDARTLCPDFMKQRAKKGHQLLQKILSLALSVSGGF